ncbi:hypothetical protein DSO57_1002058 [Entomophthora muscae]|uniref:Uncharacterized protein n=1 Tax=Entomophthora muscae TaxID=34485 RepID=A0ACC2RZQ3_9FUNG|nr:hypothetical protein DSO57_1002058 [Entomophthora muscae]
MQSYLILGLGLITSCASECSRIVERREIRELSTSEVNDFVSALSKLHEEKWEGISKYEKFTKTHVDNKQYSHFSPQFLPWHRHFIRKLEMELQRINPDVVLPYWDWSLDSQEPHNSPIMSSEYMGGNGDPANDYCVKDGPFSNWYMDYPTPHCLRRDYDEGTKMSVFSTPEAISVNLNVPKFSDFSLQLEIKHGAPHVNIGGDKGDIFPMHSPNDPIFFLHHTFIDMLWAEWQARHPDSVYEGERYRTTGTADDIMHPFNSTVASTLDTYSDFYCYTYPRYPRQIIPKAAPPGLRSLIASLARRNPFMGHRRTRITQTNVDRSLPGLMRKASEFAPYLDISGLKIKALQKRKPLPAAFIKMNNINPEEASKSLSEENSIIDRLNSFRSFVSLSQSQSLLNSFYKSHLVSRHFNK